MRPSRAAAKLCAQLRCGAKAAAARTLRSRTADFGPFCDCVVSAGGAEALLEAVGCPEAAVAADAAVVLTHLCSGVCEVTNRREAIRSARDAIPILMAALARPEDCVAASAAGALAGLTAGVDGGCGARRDAVLECGVAALAAALARPEMNIAESTACLLHNLCADGGEGRAGRCDVVAAAGGSVKALLGLLGRPEVEPAEFAACALLCLCLGSDEGCGARHAAVMSAGGAPALVAAAQRPELEVAANVMAAIRELCKDNGSPSYVNAFMSVSGAAVMARLSRRTEAGIAEHAIVVLLRLAGGIDADSGTRRDAIVAVGGLAALVDAL